MNYETFKTAIMDFVQAKLGNDTTVTLQPVVKNNHVVLDGLTIQEKSINISPTIYLNYYYEDYKSGDSIAHICEAILHAYQKSRASKDMNLSFFTDYEKVKYRIIYKLIHYEKNKELLKDVPHFPYLDFAIVFCCLILDGPNGNATILIHNHHLDYWHTTAENLLSFAQKNTPILLSSEIMRMEDVLQAFCTDIPLFTGVETDTLTAHPMYVLTNKAKLFGASCILYPNILSDFAKKLNADLYIIPSSVHEILLIPADTHTSILQLNKMIHEVNRTQVQEEEILSEHVYFYSRKDGLTIPQAS